MLAKSKTSVLILSIVFITSFALSFSALYYSNNPEPITPVAIAVTAAVFLLIAFLISRSSIFMELDEKVGFGMQGLLRWFTCGVILGILIALLNVYLLPRIDNRLFRTLVEIAGAAGAIFIAFWAAFQRSIFKMVNAGPEIGSRPSFLNTRRGEAIFLMVGGLLVTAISFYWIIKVEGGIAQVVWLSLGAACMGLAALLLGAIQYRGYKDGFVRRIGWVEFALSISGLIFLAVGFLS